MTLTTIHRQNIYMAFWWWKLAMIVLAQGGALSPLKSYFFFVEKVRETVGGIKFIAVWRRVSSAGRLYSGGNSLAVCRVSTGPAGSFVWDILLQTLLLDKSSKIV